MKASNRLTLSARTNAEWLEALRPPPSESALADLREHLMRGLRATLATRIDQDLDAAVDDFAQEALMKILDGLESFRGESRFTTWAQKIAVHVAFTELRRRRWKDVSLQDLLETPNGNDFTPSFLSDPNAAPEADVTQRDLMALILELIETELTERQRTALLAVVQGGMPLDEVARRMGTNRNALYKLIHDARQRLQKRLEEKLGLTAADVLATFEKP
ncbi:MAG: sigma-70 family RNA polymerase sigma factor [Chloroflexi bacterium]|nr:sigma-70 family RNA polymerase sigma factor [Chloroflexota bacterium]